MSAEFISHFLSTYGYWAVFFIVAMESFGIPLPGELVLVSASLWAAATGGDIVLIIAAATMGGIVGDNIGYLLGRKFGYRLLLKYGARVGLTQSHVKLGQLLFDRFGAAVVFFGRFVAVLRILVAFLSGANQLRWSKFFVANALGALVWATTVSLAAYALGSRIESLHGPATIAVALAGVLAVACGLWFIRRNEAALILEAERAYPGPIAGFQEQPTRPA